MTASVHSIRKRLLECLDRRELENLSRWEDAERRGRSTLIDYILDGRWNVECDHAIQRVVDSAKSKSNHKVTNYV